MITTTKRYPQPLPYYGGKRYLAPWIVGQLPPAERRQCYVEPYFGHGNVLMRREPVACEIVNDLNGRLVNFWEVLRNEPERFGWMIETTPQSRDVFEQACRSMDDPALEPIERALAYFTVIFQSITRSDSSRRGGISWCRRFNPAVGSLGLWKQERVDVLAERMRTVQIENRDAVELLWTLAERDYVVGYVDPPYRSADCHYIHADVDVAAATEALQAQKGHFAISGYPGEWDHLGWVLRTHENVRRQIKGKGEPRVECLWMNYEPTWEASDAC